MSSKFKVKSSEFKVKSTECKVNSLDFTLHDTLHPQILDFKLGQGNSDLGEARYDLGQEIKTLL
jgi:hypothetical protein